MEHGEPERRGKKRESDIVNVEVGEEGSALFNMGGPLAARMLVKVQKKAKKVKQKRSWTIDPTNVYKVTWDIFMGVVTLYSVVEIPFRMAFIRLPSKQTWIEFPALFVLNTFVDFLFFVDIILTCFTAYSRHDDDILVTNWKRILKRYARTWLIPDVVSTFPFWTLTHGSQNRAGVGDIMPLLRMLRLVKLLRLARLASKMSRLSVSEHVNPAMLQLVKLLFKIVFVAHLIACFWFYFNDCEPFMRVQKRDDAWLHDAGLLDDWYNKHETKGACRSGYNSTCWIKCGEPTLSSRYLASVYWTIATMMAVGYGDIFATSPFERMYAIFTQLIGALSFGFIIATVTVIIETVDPVATAKREILEEIMRYAHERQLNTKLQRRYKVTRTMAE